jgi:hypothetical protein
VAPQPLFDVLPAVFTADHGCEMFALLTLGMSQDIIAAKQRLRLPQGLQEVEEDSSEFIDPPEHRVLAEGNFPQVLRLQTDQELPAFNVVVAEAQEPLLSGDCDCNGDVQSVSLSLLLGRERRGRPGAASFGGCSVRSGPHVSAGTENALQSVWFNITNYMYQYQ